MKCLNLEKCSICGNYPYVYYYGKKKKSLILMCRLCPKRTKPFGPILKEDISNKSKKLKNFIIKIYQEWNDMIRKENNKSSIPVEFDEYHPY